MLQQLVITMFTIACKALNQLPDSIQSVTHSLTNVGLHITNSN